jgi:hypothetical protein
VVAVSLKKKFFSSRRRHTRSWSKSRGLGDVYKRQLTSPPAPLGPGDRPGRPPTAYNTPHDPIRRNLALGSLLTLITVFNSCGGGGGACAMRSGLCWASRVTCHVSRVTCHVSRVTVCVKCRNAHPEAWRNINIAISLTYIHRHIWPCPRSRNGPFLYFISSIICS